MLQVVNICLAPNKTSQNVLCLVFSSLFNYVLHNITGRYSHVLLHKQGPYKKNGKIKIPEFSRFSRLCIPSLTDNYKLKKHDIANQLKSEYDTLLAILHYFI